jgi:hypothetical protein
MKKKIVLTIIYSMSWQKVSEFMGFIVEPLCCRICSEDINVPRPIDPLLITNTAETKDTLFVRMCCPLCGVQSNVLYKITLKVDRNPLN